MSVLRATMLYMSEDWFSAPRAPQLSGHETISGTGATVGDLWRFAMSDLRMNNVRGYLAEFLVTQAVNAPGPRLEWDAYDVESPEKTRIEVKSSAYLQVWDQRQLSQIRFTGLNGRTWSPQQGESLESTFNSDVYVFCVQTAKTHPEYDPLDIGQWDFYVLPVATIRTRGFKSIGLAALQDLECGPIPYDALAVAIATAGREERVVREDDEASRS